MILQRDTEAKIWGWASPGEKISVCFIDSVYKTEANPAGEWEIILDTLPSGGPYIMKLDAGNSITISDILVGDVWLCSGQSNMELPMRRVSWVYPSDIEHSENAFIRQFYVPRKYDFNHPLDDLTSGSWVKANPVSVLDFSATAYFFAKFHLR